MEIVYMLFTGKISTEVPTKLYFLYITKEHIHVHNRGVDSPFTEGLPGYRINNFI